MTAEFLVIDYGNMDQIAQCFQSQADVISQLHQHIDQSCQQLQTDWLGEAARTFFCEMQISILPAFQRLSEALIMSQQVVNAVSMLMYEAETEAASLFKGHFDGEISPGNGEGIYNNPSKTTIITDPEYRKVDMPAFIKGVGDTDEIDIYDVDQGNLGDCYLMAGTAAIANTRPDIIRNAIRDNGDGTYTVTLYPEDGVKGFFGFRSKTEVTVTNEFVHSKSSGMLSYAQLSNDSEIWPMLIEKAYAKHKGGYDKIESGSAGEFMAILTGNDSSYTNIEDIDFDTLKKHLDNGDAVTVGTPDALNNPPPFVHEDHAYVIQNIDIDNETITLYNPWGHDHPTVSFDEFRENYEGVSVNEKK